MRCITTKKALAAVAAGAVVIGAAGVAFAYFTTSGSGSGAGAVGTSSALTLHQTAPVNADYSSSDGKLYPGTTLTVKWTVDNPSPGHQRLNVISLASWSSDKLGCDSVSQPTWITMPDVTVNADYGPGNGQAVSPSGLITFNNDASASQDACKNASLTFSYTSN